MTTMKMVKTSTAKRAPIPIPVPKSRTSTARTTFLYRRVPLRVQADVVPVDREAAETVVPALAGGAAVVAPGRAAEIRAAERRTVAEIASLLQGYGRAGVALRRGPFAWAGAARR